MPSLHLYIDIPLVVGGALVVGDTTFSPLTGGLNANEISLGHSIGTDSYDDATIGENTVARETNDEIIKALDENDANEVGDGGTSDAEGDGYECVVCFQDGMKEVDSERLCFDAHEIERGVEVDDLDVIVCEVKDHSPDCIEHRQVGQHPVLHMVGIQPSIQIVESHALRMWIIRESGATLLSDLCLNQEVESTCAIPCRLALFLYL